MNQYAFPDVEDVLCDTSGRSDPCLLAAQCLFWCSQWILFVNLRMGVTGMTAGRCWRYREFGIQGLHDELRPGRPRTYADDKVAEVINRALQTKPSDGSIQWSARSLAAETGISKSTVHHWLKTFCLHTSNPSPIDIRILDRSLLCRTGQARRRPLSESSGEGSGALRGRKTRVQLSPATACAEGCATRNS
jgi:hypothetical protein